mmetsp:Transcript_15183/g.35767  ORF Transcript_15183/g.35767 Transcript_15183/m.35767 type:complete len:164 (-) Transcript_15183:81-572(-)
MARSELGKLVALIATPAAALGSWEGWEWYTAWSKAQSSQTASGGLVAATAVSQSAAAAKRVTEQGYDKVYGYCGALLLAGAAIWLIKKFPWDRGSALSAFTQPNEFVYDFDQGDGMFNQADLDDALLQAFFEEALRESGQPVEKARRPPLQPHPQIEELDDDE